MSKNNDENCSGIASNANDLKWNAEIQSSSKEACDESGPGLKDFDKMKSAMPRLDDGERETGICVRSDQFNGLQYSIILHRDYGEFVVQNIQMAQGTWLLFIPTDEKLYIECEYKKVAVGVQETQPRRLSLSIPGWLCQTFQVQAFVNQIDYSFNQVYNLCMDAILGKLLVCKNDDYINKVLKTPEEGEKIEMAAAYMRNFATGIHWVAIAVNEPKCGETYFRKIKGLPYNVLVLADLCYGDGEEDEKNPKVG